MSQAANTVRRKNAGTTEATWVRYTLIGTALLFMALFLVLPLAAVFAEALRKGFDAYWAALQEPDALSSIKLTFITALIAVPVNLARRGPTSRMNGLRIKSLGHVVTASLVMTSSALEIPRMR